MLSNTVVKPDLKELLTIMRRMHVAAVDGNWDTVDKLDNQRQTFLRSLTECPDLDDHHNNSMVCEIIDLDQAVLGLANAGMTQIAGAVSSNS
ncbi:MAG: flagellar protein FliT [Gammaproteobacteria bacterium]|nr:flagellar protein FliT [Gammaproteobacteria bacterium]